MGKARDNLTGKSYSLFTIIYGRLFYLVKFIYSKFKNYSELRKSIVFKGNSKIGIHHNTLLSLKNSKIIINNGTLKIGIDFGYFDPGEFDPRVDKCRIVLHNSTLEIFGNVSLYPGLILQGSNAHIIIRNNTKINAGIILSKKKIEIGEECYLGRDIVIRDNDGKGMSEGGDDEKVETLVDVVIGNHCMIAQGCMILKGVKLGDNTIVSARAMVTKSFPPNVVISGIPARIIKENVSWSA
jgi:acetyltransferase-like isoleucine patch superfamily enzyme